MVSTDNEYGVNSKEPSSASTGRTKVIGKYTLTEHAAFLFI